MEKIKQPEFKIIYEKKDITAQISSSVLSLFYTDNEHGKSDEISISLENSLVLWNSLWFPDKGDTLGLSMGYKDEALLPCGNFEIDEIKFSGSPDTVEIKALSTPIKLALRQNNSRSFENTTLVDIAKEIAKKHGFSVIGNQGFVNISRVTQKHESDLTFLNRIAQLYGYIFKITDNKLSFIKIEELEARSSVFTIKKEQCLSYQLVDTAAEQYQRANVTYFSSQKKKTVTASVKNEHFNSSKSSEGDVLKLNSKASSPAEAKLLAAAALKQTRDFQVEGNISIIGNPKLIAGNVVTLLDFGKLDGKYRISTSTHTIDSGNGYTTDISIKKVLANA